MLIFSGVTRTRVTFTFPWEKNFGSSVECNTTGRTAPSATTERWIAASPAQTHTTSVAQRESAPTESKRMLKDPGATFALWPGCNVNSCSSVTEAASGEKKRCSVVLEQPVPRAATANSAIKEVKVFIGFQGLVSTTDTRAVVPPRLPQPAPQ